MKNRIYKTIIMFLFITIIICCIYNIYSSKENQESFNESTLNKNKIDINTQIGILINKNLKFVEDKNNRIQEIKKHISIIREYEDYYTPHLFQKKYIESLNKVGYNDILDSKKEGYKLYYTGDMFVYIPQNLYGDILKD